MAKSRRPVPVPGTAAVSRSPAVRAVCVRFPRFGGLTLSSGRDGPPARRAGVDPNRTTLQPLPECSSGPGTRSDHELDLGMKTLMVLKLPQAFADF
jgi:hypothetical protein